MVVVYKLVIILTIPMIQILLINNVLNAVLNANNVKQIKIIVYHVNNLIIYIIIPVLINVQISFFKMIAILFVNLVKKIVNIALIQLYANNVKKLIMIIIKINNVNNVINLVKTVVNRLIIVLAAFKIYNFLIINAFKIVLIVIIIITIIYVKNANKGANYVMIN